MFTGIIETTAAILDKASTGITLVRPDTFDDLRLGNSICVAGVCLSVVACDEKIMRFDVVNETWSKTKLGRLRVGDKVNIERAMKLSDRLEGHIVQGHVEGVGTVASSPLPLIPEEEANGIYHQIVITLPAPLLSLIVPKGSIAIDGVSLTVADVQSDKFSVSLIPHTLKQTTLGLLQPGDPVNLETDIVGRYVQAMVKTVR